MTIKDLAAKTGYAVGTVSRALNGQPNVSEKAREAILAAAKECGFELNLNAKQLKQQHSTTILVIVKGTGNELFSSLVESIQSLIAKTPYRLEVDYLDEDKDEVRRALQLYREKKPQGILFLGGVRENFQQSFAPIEVPCVLMTNSARDLGFDNLSSVSTDDIQVGYQAVETLIRMGHKRIAVLGGDLSTSEISQFRYRGCSEAFAEFGIPFDTERDYRRIRFSFQDGYQATEELLRQEEDYTAIFAMADVMAVGAIRALADQGRQVPEDVSVLGVDGLSLGAYLVPRLATLRQDVEALARRGVQILLDCIENKQPASHETVPFTLRQGESMGSATN